MAITNDRTVHARCPQFEVVRYNRAGKWYLEFTDPKKQRRHVTIKDAAFAANNYLAEVFPGRPGGGAFDRIMKGVP